MMNVQPQNTAVVFLFDVDNTLMDSDRIIADLRWHLDHEAGTERVQQYWDIFERLRDQLGYADYLGALQQYRNEFPHDFGVMSVSCFLIDYPFANRLFPESLDVIQHLSRCGTTAILTDGDVVLQPHKLSRSGLYAAVEGRVLIYVHKECELPDVELRFPASHYVLIDDKLRILTAVKRIWGSRVTTVFVKQGHYAFDPGILASYPPADLSIEHIGDLLKFHLKDFKIHQKPT